MMDNSERRQLIRYAMRTPIRFKAMGIAADKSEHFTEALNVSRGGVLFRNVGTAADRHADRSDASHARGGDRR